MKALFIHDHKFPCKDGIYYYSYGFDNEFFNRYLLVFDQLEIIGRNVEITLEQTINTTKVNSNIRFYNINSLSQLRSRKARRDIDKKIINSDYVIIRLPSILGLYAIKSAKKFNKPFLVEVVGSAWDSLWNQGISKKIVAPVLSILYKKAIFNAPYVVYVTEKYLQKNYPTTGQSISCSNVTLPSVSNSINKRLEKIKNIDLKNKVIIGTCATLNVYKGQQNVIEAMSTLESLGYNIEYQLVGGGDQSNLKLIADRYEVTDSVKFLGKKSHSDVFLWLDEIDIYIQPSLTEGLPRTVIEAMSRGCPIIGSNAGGIPELIDDMFVFKKGSKDSFCEVFSKLTVDLMLEQALENHNNSKKYLKNILYTRRTNFLKQFIKESIN